VAEHSAEYVADIEAAEARQRRGDECSHAVFTALAPLLIEYGSVMTERMVRAWLKAGLSGSPTTSQVASHGGDSPQRGIGGQGRAGTAPAVLNDGSVSGS
jgi:hypothetical protein